MIGFRPGHSPLHQAHPYTPLAIATAMFCLVFAANTPAEAGVVILAAVVFSAVGGATAYVAKPALVLALPTWLLLLVLHGVFGPEPRQAFGPVMMSEPGLARALIFGSRLTAILFAFLTVLACVSPARLVEAMTERGAPFARVYLLVSTLTMVPRLRQRAMQILEAQQCRGLKLRGSPLARFKALGPLVLPLVLGALAEVDEQVLALDTRGAASGHQRTTMNPPRDSAAEFGLRWLCLVVVFAAWGARLLVLLAPLGHRAVELSQ